MHGSLVRFNISAQAMRLIVKSDLYNDPDKYEPGSVDAKEASVSLRYSKVIRRGYGATNIVHTTRGAAQVIKQYCETNGQTLKLQGDPAASYDGNALLLVANRIMWVLGELKELDR